MGRLDLVLGLEVLGFRVMLPPRETMRREGYKT
jgi:hypothetical protein